MNVNVTDSAVTYLNKILQNTGKEYLRFDIGTSTWCDYDFALSPSEKTDKDFVIESQGFNFLIRDEIKNVYENAKVDYVAEGFSMGLKVELS